MKARLPKGYGRPDPQAMMRQVQKMQDEIRAKQAELEAREYTGSASGEMVTVTMSLCSKLPKRAVIGCERAYIEIDDYPRAQAARVVDAATGAVTQIQVGETGRALAYEVTAMEQAVRTGDASAMRLGWSRDVMNTMTALRREWGVRYPGEEL